MATRRYGRRSVETSNEEKLLFPADGLRKGDLIDHYERVWERLRPHLADRPLMLQRFPDGIGEEGFYQKRASDFFPAWIRRVEVPVKQGGRQELVVCEQKATAAYLANLACVTPHVWLSRCDRLDVPDQLVLDLDPSADDFAAVREAALRCKALLDEIGLSAVAKTTGSRGVHVVVPLRRGEGFDAVRDFARRLADALSRRHPDALTTEARMAKRGGRLYLDVARNGYAQTVVAPYAVRARAGAPVAMPVSWDELRRENVHARTFTLANTRRRLEAPDPWAGWRRGARSLRAARERLARI